jgi:hypothetical protein
MYEITCPFCGKVLGAGDTSVTGILKGNTEAVKGGEMKFSHGRTDGVRIISAYDILCDGESNGV